MERYNTGAFVAAAAVGTRGAVAAGATLCGRRTWSSGAAAAPWRRAHVAAPRRDTPRCNLPGNIEDIPVEPIPPAPLELPAYWARAGVYGVYSTTGELQYVAATRDVRAAIAGHRVEVKDETRVAMVRMMTVDDADAAPLDNVAETWVMTMVQLGQIPPGNGDAAPEWRVEPAPPATRDVRFTGSGLGAESEIKEILRAHRVVLFMKGQRDAPQCGFSQHVVGLLEDVVGDSFVCVDCLDEIRNPGLRQGIKDFSAWPTIPQLYINGDFVGGADIVTEMEANGELQAALEVALAG